MKNNTQKTSKLKIIALSAIFISLSSVSSLSTANSSTEQEHEHKVEKQHSEHANEEKNEHGNERKEESHDEATHNEKESDGHGHKEEAGEHGEASESGVNLSPSQLTLAGIKVEVLTPQAMSFDIYAPGEIKANDYTGYLVSPRVDSVILKRHVALGDHVEINQPLVTLFSESVAEAQASYRVANAEWQRVQKLGRKAVGDKRYIESQTDYEADFGRLTAFGLSVNAINSLTGKSTKLGEYTLTAAIAGAVLSDDFRQGQRVESGDSLIELANEHTLWVEARLAPTMQINIPVGSKAMVKVGSETYIATVTQKAHTIDPITRTRTVRLQVENNDHKLHPGLFADIYFAFDTTTMVLAVPEDALMRGGDGDWMVFVEENGKFSGKEIELGRTLSGKMREISDIKAGTRVVTQGAFHVAAEIAKGGFDAHNH